MASARNQDSSDKSNEAPAAPAAEASEESTQTLEAGEALAFLKVKADVDELAAALAEFSDLNKLINADLKTVPLKMIRRNGGRVSRTINPIVQKYFPKDESEGTASTAA